ncbi:MAG: hypothetical protein DRG78_03430 [Epsilonproteobacteria bacterium]|nr:MAG: hypothetical protein DRG78_03430 [Campylobacterota bacterium]
MKDILESTDIVIEMSIHKFPELEKKYSKKEVKIAHDMAMKKKDNMDPKVIEQIIKDLRT